MVDSSCPSCANTATEYKKGGKVKKNKKSPGVSHSVLCERCSKRALNASVLLRKGNAPRRSNPGVAKRLLSQGSAFGGGLPRPLQGNAYASAPPVAMPMGRMDFISSGDSYYYNRRRDHRDDFQPQPNPSGIRADVSPSIRAVVNSSAVETPNSGLALSRSSDGAQAVREAFTNMPRAIFQGEVPRVGGANLAPSARASASQPTTGFMNTKAAMVGSSSYPVYGSAFGSSEDASVEDLDELYGTIGGRRQGRDQGERMNRAPPQFPTAQPGTGKSASASARGMRRGGNVF